MCSHEIASRVHKWNYQVYSHTHLDKTLGAQ